MTDKSGKCCHCICTEVQPKNSPIHDDLRNDHKLLETVKYTSGGYLGVWFNIARAVAQVKVL